ncbi:MAG TPA: 3'-5' exonuclease [Candidatus Yonathbacteria bacterium]|nr:3'-5' exonuclease [Candidatus Yonathbacteria bacterium]
MIVIDGEMSGVNPQKNSLVSFGAVDFNNPDRTFYEECRVWEGEDAEIDPEGLAVNGFTEEEVTSPDRQSVEELAQKFYDWMQPIEDKTLCAQNVSLDRLFINDALHRAKINYQFGYRTVDVHTTAYADHMRRGLPILQKNDHSGLNLGKNLNYVGIPEEPRPHNALTGAKSQAEVMSRILYGKKLLPDFEEFDIPEMFLG